MPLESTSPDQNILTPKDWGNLEKFTTEGKRQIVDCLNSYAVFSVGFVLKSSTRLIEQDPADLNKWKVLLPTAEEKEQMLAQDKRRQLVLSMLEKIVPHESMQIVLPDKQDKPAGTVPPV